MVKQHQYVARTRGLTPKIGSRNNKRTRATRRRREKEPHLSPCISNSLPFHIGEPAQPPPFRVKRPNPCLVRGPRNRHKTKFQRLNFGLDVHPLNKNSRILKKMAKEIVVANMNENLSVTQTAIWVNNGGIQRLLRCPSGTTYLEIILYYEIDPANVYIYQGCKKLNICSRIGDLMPFSCINMQHLRGGKGGNSSATSKAKAMLRRLGLLKKKKSNGESTDDNDEIIEEVDPSECTDTRLDEILIEWKSNKVTVTQELLKAINDEQGIRRVKRDRLSFMNSHDYPRGTPVKKRRTFPPSNFSTSYSPSHSSSYNIPGPSRSTMNAPSRPYIDANNGTPAIKKILAGSIVNKGNFTPIHSGMVVKFPRSAPGVFSYGTVIEFVRLAPGEPNTFIIVYWLFFIDEIKICKSYSLS